MECLWYFIFLSKWNTLPGRSNLEKWQWLLNSLSQIEIWMKWRATVDSNMNWAKSFHSAVWETLWICKYCKQYEECCYFKSVQIVVLSSRCCYIWKKKYTVLIVVVRRNMKEPKPKENWQKTFLSCVFYVSPFPFFWLPLSLVDFSIQLGSSQLELLPQL